LAIIGQFQKRVREFEQPLEQLNATDQQLQEANNRLSSTLEPKHGYNYRPLIEEPEDQVRHVVENTQNQTSNKEKEINL
jgi:hypothetical protein